MEITFKSGALEDIDFWIKAGNKKIQKRITDLLNSIEISP